MATTSDVLVDVLHQWGVEVIFGMPGDGVNGVIEALREREHDISFVQVRHEESAALAAVGYAKFTGKLGVCLATSGPGALHLLNGLYDAKLDGQPILAITGNQFHDLMSTHGQQDVSLDRVFNDVADYNVRVMGPNHIENAAHLACRHSIAQRSVSHVTIPIDIQSMKVDWDGSDRNVPHHVSSLQTLPCRKADGRDLKEASKILSDGKRVAILAGRGALGASEELETIAGKLGAPVSKSLLGKAVLSDRSEYTTGGIGLLGSEPSSWVMENCDTLLLVGTSFPYLNHLPEPGQAKAVQIDIDPARIGLRYPIDTALVGDSKETLSALIEMIDEKEDKSFLDEAQEKMKEWWELMEERGTREEIPMKPQVLAWEIGKQLPDDALVTADSGTVTTWWARQIPATVNQMHHVSGNLATMACALPYAIAGRIAHQDRPTIAFIGDGGMAMLLGELATCVKYKLPIKIFVVNNGTLGQIKWEQIVFLGNPEYECDLQDIDFARVAEGFGAKGLTLKDPSECSKVVEEALAHDGPVVVDAYVDPHEPPMPPSVEPKQAVQFARSMARGEKHRGDIIKTVVKNKTKHLT